MKNTKFSVMAFLLFGLFYIATSATDFTYNYGCNTGNLNTTVVSDKNLDGMIDWHIFNWCDGNSTQDPIEFKVGEPIRTDDMEKGKRPKLVDFNPATGSYTEIFYDIVTGSESFRLVKLDFDNKVSCYRTTAKASFNTEESVADLSVLPNPASNNINVQFSLSEANRVVVRLYNQSGIEVARLYDGIAKGNNTISYNTNNLSNGVYFVQSNVGTTTKTQKVFVSK